ncbi:zinc ribbon domain-containing protein [Fructilactobacillus fructivorans]|uniref:Zinc-ribbon domain-containing protein n=1 Tax=Fructilactobacillus fructivorans TaxID=1614 RepID=A0A0C1PR13_9LACO|nr:zinc ribbon domain-containing protein [Fructilactobacillus fructivorans]KID42316.1 hypothetical protein LfDm3_0245 [Fructilactobacillus fructivorans]MCT0151065.1 zinc ribbon domain-containing protein [Fructilactobacillus fructivorans]MCT2867377.1 zinc ribbon domain-containing protein [Fructilactobacillus fructivorans]MCT2869104.1 zinc ribbon domain-containing protein [Fructilactobacillus fructivorans]MCT2873176.1 zinc ribbon domain-containing protein [Fructilactobacillus fructivorans]
MALKTRFCPNCGAEIPIDVKFCTKCGYKQPSIDELEEMNKEEATTTVDVEPSEKQVDDQPEIVIPVSAGTIPDGYEFKANESMALSGHYVPDDDQSLDEFQHHAFEKIRSIVKKNHCDGAFNLVIQTQIDGDSSKMFIFAYFDMVNSVK